MVNISFTMAGRGLSECTMANGVSLREYRQPSIVRAIRCLFGII